MLEVIQGNDIINKVSYTLSVNKIKNILYWSVPTGTSTIVINDEVFSIHCNENNRDTILKSLIKDIMEVI